MPFTPFSAKNASVRVNSPSQVVVTAKEWVVDPKTDKADTTNFEGDGFGDAIGTIIEADISIREADWDATANPYDNPPNFQPTQVVTGLQLFMATTGSPFWLFPEALVVGSPNMAQVRKAMRYSVNMYGKGAFEFPTGEVVLV